MYTLNKVHFPIPLSSLSFLRTPRIVSLSILLALSTVRYDDNELAAVQVLQPHRPKPPQNEQNARDARAIQNL